MNLEPSGVHSASFLNWESEQIEAEALDAKLWAEHGEAIRDAAIKIKALSQYADKDALVELVMADWHVGREAYVWVWDALSEAAS